MSKANEITIRVSSPLLFIDDDASSAEPTARESFQSLTVVKRSPQSSSDTSPSKTGNDRKSRLELTIKGENTVINIQTVKPAKQIKHDTDVEEIYELINQSVQQIFQSPGKEEIEKALESAGFKERKFTKKGVWKMLSAKASTSAGYPEEERYPSIVLLQDPEPESIEDKPKLEFRSRSMMSLRDITPRSLETERSHLEKEKKCLQVEREGLEQGKNKLEREKRSLERSKSFFFQDQNILKEKRQVLQQVKKSSSDSNTLLNKEKLCLELERQLLEDEKKIITEEQEILGMEKEIIEKEKNILGGEKNVLDEERFILGKEKMYKSDQSDVLSEIEGVFEDACNIGARCRHWVPNFPPCSFNPVYVPVYNLPRPFSSGRRSKSVQTQTMETPAPDAGLPFELLSGIFPRVVITSMGAFPDDNANAETCIKEVSEPPTRVVKKIAAKKPQRKPTLKTLQLPRTDLSLKAGAKKAKGQSLKISDKRGDDPETEESGIQTLTSEAQKDDNSNGTAETLETLHFGLADDFYSNEAIFPGKGSSAVDDDEKRSQLPLTSVGYDMFEKLTQLSLTRDLPQVTAAQEGNEPIDKKLNNASNLNLHVSGDGVAITLPGNISMHFKRPVCCGLDYDLQDYGAPDLTHENFEDDGKLLVKRSDLWHDDGNLSRLKSRKKFEHFCQPAGISIRVPDGPEINLTLGAAEHNSTKLAKPEDIKFLIEKPCGCDRKIPAESVPGKIAFPPTTGNQLSPRTADLLEALRKKLAFSQSEQRVLSYGQSQKPTNFDGLYFIKQFTKPEKPDVKPREYLCEECLTTMRLYEDDFHTVQDLVDKFEKMNKFGYK